MKIDLPEGESAPHQSHQNSPEGDVTHPFQHLECRTSVMTVAHVS